MIRRINGATRASAGAATESSQGTAAALSKDSLDSQGGARVRVGLYSIIIALTLVACAPAVRDPDRAPTHALRAATESALARRVAPAEPLSEGSASARLTLARSCP